ncbi:ABC transporter permease [Propionicicella superfundia]|uniref:ABC transporter permease n=1 Tax=Propionicicella superfundia TaxID=348582 RepID=UPI0003F81627|nr:FtsX-like permease family protein [Propionicicella superfundia]
MRPVSAAWRDLRRHLLRNALTAVTMFIGVLSMVVVSAVSGVASDMLLAAREQADGRKFTYEATVTAPVADVETTALDLQDRLGQRLGEWVPVVVSVGSSPSWMTTEDRAFRREGQALAVEWDAGNVAAVRRLPVISGSFPLSDEPYPPRLAINEAAAVAIGYPDRREIVLAASADGPWVVFGIDAVLADGADSPQAYASIATMPLVGGSDHGGVLRVRMTTPTRSESDVRQAVSDVMTDVGLAGAPEVRRADTTWQVEEQIGSIRAIFSGFSVLMLAIAAVGILNVGLSSVRERSRELVVRRALGARRIDVFWQVMVTEILIALSVALLSIIAAFVAVYVVLPRWIPQRSAISHPDVPWGSCAIGIVAAVTTAMLGSTVPAWKASRLPVAQALRE